MEGNTKANGNPTKGFFINMLTRDIELNDAILDLLDNCLDGVVRIRAKEGINRSTPNFYNGYSAKITISKDTFIIEDNCGGIPLDIAVNHAFRMGRDEDSPRDNSSTVGIYGIGMKRAIFKIGKKAEVRSITTTDAFTVEIPENWENDIEWAFPINSYEKKADDKCGTRIEINSINTGIRELWAEEGHLETFVSNLIDHIRKCYSLIIERGFKVSVNEFSVEADPVSFVWSDDPNGVKPFIYKYDDSIVSVKLVVGFYAAPPTVEESDSMTERNSRRSKNDAGWTVICNDRVILYNNKDHLTGWGEGTVPKYHPQFIGICGIVEFSSNMPEKLPMTTTKRGIDLTSPLYAMIKKKMCEGLKLFTNFTNEWKGIASSETKYFKESTNVSLEAIANNAIEKKLEFHDTKDGGQQARPLLPKPKNRGADTVWIRFSAKESDYESVSNYLFEEKRSTTDVGLECFKRCLSDAISSGEEL